jgi:hypothetical protein
MTGEELRAIENQAGKWKEFPGVQGTLARLLSLCTEEIRRLQKPCIHDVEAEERRHYDAGYF